MPVRPGHRGALFVLQAVRDGAWITRERLRTYPALFLALWLAGSAGVLAFSQGVLDPWGRPVGSDFMGFWASSSLLLSGDPTLVYDGRALHAAQQAASGVAEVNHYTMLYPPPGLLLMLPAALLPYLQSLALWVGGTLAAYLLVMWLAWPRWQVAWLALGAPAVFITVAHGQNGFLSTALLGGALLLLPRRQMAAGILIGLLAYKPQLGLVIPLALAAGGHWRAFGAAAATVAILCLAGTIAFGWAIWPVWLDRLPFAMQVLEQGFVPHFKMQSLYASLRLLGTGHEPAMMAQWGLAGLAIAGTAALWRWNPSHRLNAAALAAATLLATPFLLDYDLTLLAIPLVLMGRDGAEHGFLPWEKTMLAVAWVAPLLLRSLAQGLGVGLAPLVVGTLYVLIARRALALRRAA
jgi:alpha-1,2-mannosyltransferase